MPRTKGAKDKRKRRKRKFYAGKLIKKKRKRYGRFIPYVSKRREDTPIKLWFWEERPMSREGYFRFAKEIRPYMKRIVYKPILRIDVMPELISNKESVEEFCLEHLWSGVWLMKGFSKGKNKYGVKNVTLCKIKITEHADGPQARIIENLRLFRFWFWRKN